MEEVKKGLHSITSDLQQLVKNVRTLTFQIASPLLYEVGFKAAVHALLEDMFKPVGISFFIPRSEEVMLPLKVKVLLYRMIRELLVNIIKHAHADFVSIDMHHVGDHYEIVIEDNGIGIYSKSPQRNTTSRGFLEIREGLLYLGGQFRFENLNGRGTRVVLTVPLNLGLENKMGSETE